MSRPVGPSPEGWGKISEIRPTHIGETRRVDIVAYVKDKSDQWQKVDLEIKDTDDEGLKRKKESTLKTMEQAFQAMVQTGLKGEKKGKFEELERPGKKFEILKGGVFEEGSNRYWGTKETVKTSTAVSQFFGAETKLEVEVKASKFEVHSFKDHDRFQTELQAKGASLASDSIQNHLQTIGFQKSEIQSFETKYQEFSKASATLQGVLNGISQDLASGKKDAAMDKSTDLSKAYVDFTHQVAEWQQTQWEIEHKARNDPSIPIDEIQALSIDAEHVGKMATAAQDFLRFVDPKGEQTAEALKGIQQAQANFTNYQQLTVKSLETITHLERVQANFLVEVQNAIAALGDAHGDHAREHNLTEQQYNEHKQALQALESSIENFRKIMTENTWADLHMGRVQRGVDAFAGEVSEQIENYQKALERVMIAQKVAQGRNLGRELSFNQVGVNKIQEIQLAMGKLVYYAGRYPCTDAQGKPLFEPSKLTGPLASVERAERANTASQVFDPFVTLLENTHQNNLKETEKLGQFVELWQTPRRREVFEMIMLEYGISQAQSALIINDYTKVYEAKRAHNTAFQEIVDLANQKKYEGAYTEYLALLEGDLSKAYITATNAGKLHMLNLNLGDYETGLRRFARKKELPASFQALEDALRTERASIHQSATGFISGAEVDKKAAPSNQSLHALYETAEEEIQKQRRFFSANNQFQDFFYPQGLDRPQLQSCMHLAKINPRQISDLNSIAQRYAKLIGPLQHLQTAIQVEQDPQKRRALQAQLKQEASNTRPEQETLRRQYEALGGDRFFDRMNQYAGHVGVANENLEGKMQAEAGALRALMGQRLSFFDRLYVDVEIQPGFQTNLALESLSSKNSHVKELIKSSAELGWDEGKIASFNDFFDRYQAVAAGFNRAKKAYEADPENPDIQAAYKKQAKSSQLQLGRFRKELSEKFSNLNLFIGYVQAACDLNKEGIETAEIEKIQRNLTQLEAGVNEISTLSEEAKQVANEAMSWEKGYLSALTKRPSEFKNIIIGENGESFEAVLQSEGITSKDLQNVGRLYQKYQTQLKEIARLERRLEADPEESATQTKFLKELENKRGVMQKLEKEYRALETKIKRFDELLEQAKISLENKRERTREEEGLLRLPQVEEAFNQKWIDATHTYERFRLIKSKKRSRI